jgi:Zn-dependent protease with chaperone function
MQESHPTQLQASYFDGVSAKAKPVTLWIDAQSLHIQGDGVQRSVPLREVQWPERTRHGMRKAHFQSGGAVQTPHTAEWDTWRASHGHSESWLVNVQQSWRWVAVFTVGLVALFAALQMWGLPVAARAIVAFVPTSVDASLGEASLSAIDQQLMKPSKLPLAEQQRLQAAFAQAVATLPADTVPPWRLVFRQSRIGANAFALPGGTIVMTDELVQLVGGDAQVITAVLGHELGHVQQRHGLRMLVQVTVLGTLSSAVLGDFSTLLASVPVLMGHASYSRDAEREADAAAVQLLKRAGISPLVMVTMFDKLNEKRGDKEGTWLGIAFASHPADAERIQFFKNAAAQQ